jgi:hypothetical protein
VDVLDGLAAQYNLIVLGGPIDNLYTRRREKEGVSTMSKRPLLCDCKDNLYLIYMMSSSIFTVWGSANRGSQV